MAEEHRTASRRLAEDLEATRPFAELVLGEALGPERVRRAIELVDAGELPQAAVLKALPETCPRPR
jgi:hypothetical protein